MLAITAGELTDARDEYVQIMDSIATIERQTEEDDGRGGQITTPQLFTGIPCRIVDLRVNRPIEAHRVDTFSAVMTLEIIFPHGTDVQPKDKIAVDGVRYEVTQDNGVRTDNLLTMANVVTLDHIG